MHLQDVTGNHGSFSPNTVRDPKITKIQVTNCKQGLPVAAPDYIHYTQTNSRTYIALVCTLTHTYTQKHYNQFKNSS